VGDGDGAELRLRCEGSGVNQHMRQTTQRAACPAVRDDVSTDHPQAVVSPRAGEGHASNTMRNQDRSPWRAGRRGCPTG